MSIGFRWAWGLLDGFSRALGVVILIAAVALPSFLTARPTWESLLVAAVLLLAIFAEGSYRVWQAVSEQLVPPNEIEEPGEPVSDHHRKELQAIAEQLLEGVKHTQTAYHLSHGAERVNIALAFNEHFPEIEQGVARWNLLVAALAETERALRDWVEGQLSAIGITGGPTANFIAREAQSANPHFEVDETASEVRVGVTERFVLNLSGVQERAAKEAALREIFDRATKQPERARIDLTRAQMRTPQRELIEALELVRDKVVIRGRCQLCA